MREFTKISSKDNQLVKEIALLQRSSKARNEKGLFVLEGLRLCMDAAENGYSFSVLAVSEDALEKHEKDVEYLCSFSKSAYILTNNIFSKISDTVSPQGILCLCEIPKYDIDIIKNGGKYVGLENIQDPSNLGAISRTAEAFGLDGMIISGGCDPYSSKSLRASMGALLRIPIILTHEPVNLFKNFGITTYAAVVDKDEKKLNEVVFDKNSAVIIGNEANGLLEQTADACDVKITIPMSGRAESLNAGVAAAVIMWEMCK